MVRKKLIVKKIENPSSLQVTYCKRKDGIIKKASELAVLCDTDVGLVMFSPTGRLTSFASNGRIEDIFLRYVDRPNELRGGPIENEERLYRSLKNSKYEGEILEQIAKLLEKNSMISIS
ncbi:agamous-like MADS-box protein AGL104 [Quercus robur]|uniref:agamous-like MADS-box protein AGL104 n=1 Tax=Quercus robur TaxID=38942 RepID=UPI002161A98C|nr:agamous-like MADS-box protein AGL104 [Quercus robur]